MQRCAAFVISLLVLGTLPIAAQSNDPLALLSRAFEPASLNGRFLGPLPEHLVVVRFPRSLGRFMDTRRWFVAWWRGRDKLYQFRMNLEGSETL